MRYIFAALSLLITAASTRFDITPPSPESGWCRYGICRFGQVFTTIDAERMDVSNVAALLNLDPANPLVWSTYAELLSAKGRSADAASAFDEAVRLGPHMAPVLMRRANFDFASGRFDDGVHMTNRLLRETSAFDQPLFSYLSLSGRPVSSLAGAAVPPLPRPAASWLAWLRKSGSDRDLRDLWIWMQANQLLDRKSAADIVSALWQKRAWMAAQELWSDWLGPERGDYLNPERLSDTSFAGTFSATDTGNPADSGGLSGSPFEWTVKPIPEIGITRSNGLQVRFPGSANFAFADVRQFTTVTQGRYRFTADVAAEGITTDQGPFFHIFDPANPKGLSFETPQIRGSVPRSPVSVDVTVPSGIHPLEILLERRMSDRFDNKIAGTLHLYRVSLKPLP